MLEGIRTEWGHPYNVGNSYDHEEEEWLFEEPVDFCELLEVLEVPVENEMLFNDIRHALIDSQWNRKWIFGGSEDEWLINGWAKFSEQVKYQTRYVFFRIHTYSKDSYYDISPAKMLDQIGDIITSANLIKTFDVGTKFVRARILDDSQKRFTKAEDLGPPPQKYAKQPNRMSPAGIPMFYGAFDENTAIAETYNAQSEETIVAIGTFSTLKKMCLLDLSDLPDLPSIFDPDMRSQRASIKFLMSFVEDLSRPIKRDKKDYIEYIPTQVFTEYFCHLFKDVAGNQIQGILYPSARNSGSVACVLFLANDNCCDSLSEKEEETDPTKQKWLKLDSSAHFLITTSWRKELIEEQSR